MSTKTRRTLVKALKAVLILTGALLLSPASAHYSLPPLPPELYAPIAPAATTTSFTVSWQSTSGYLCKLSEKVNDGVWASLSNTSSPTNTITLTRAIGKYAYQLTCIGLPGGGSVGPVTSVAVVATIPILDPLDAQLGYQFQVRTGDIDSDGKKDIYLKRTSGGNADNGVIDKTILTQNIDGHFEVLQDPTSGQFSTAGGWPISAGVTAVVNDFNVDGRVDVLLKNLDTVISNVDDQIIFSSGIFFNGAAQVATSIDFEFEKFFRDTYNWILDPNYFSQALVAGLPAYNLAVTFKVWFCINYGLSSSCVNTSRSVYNKTITLAKMGLSGYQTTAAAEAALAASLGFANYDGFRCKLICGWLDFYRFYGSIVFNVVDVWTPTTETPAFDDINYSKPASETEPSLSTIIGADIVNAPYSALEEFSGYLSERLGVEINIGTDAASCEDAPKVQSLVFIPAIPACGTVLSGVINTIGIILLDASFDSLEQPEPIYRVYGGEAQLVGRFWTPQFPLLVPNYRDAAGLPHNNDCTQMAFGSVSDKSTVIERLAQPIINTPPGYFVSGGGVTEYEFTGGSHLMFTGKIIYGAAINFSPPC
jgi:hypothetical protein